VNSNVSKSNQTGLSINGSENMVAANVVTDNSVDGIVIGASATDNQISDNVLARNPT
jgi:nitrous oxidase accessory protein NosD